MSVTRREFLSLSAVLAGAGLAYAGLSIPGPEDERARSYDPFFYYENNVAGDLPPLIEIPDVVGKVMNRSGGITDAQIGGATRYLKTLVYSDPIYCDPNRGIVPILLREMKGERLGSDPNVADVIGSALSVVDFSLNSQIPDVRLSPPARLHLANIGLATVYSPYLTIHEVENNFGVGLGLDIDPRQTNERYLPHFTKAMPKIFPTDVPPTATDWQRDVYYQDPWRAVHFFTSWLFSNVFAESVNQGSYNTRRLPNVLELASNAGTVRERTLNLIQTADFLWEAAETGTSMFNIELETNRYGLRINGPDGLFDPTREFDERANKLGMYFGLAALQDRVEAKDPQYIQNNLAALRHDLKNPQEVPLLALR